ncbi:hypothetical protein GJ496_004017 [Pomphorhynchus laevis]|nr:hypothetical protein GJ496_004017 [Pomphorhynchus laevis]
MISAIQTITQCLLCHVCGQPATDPVINKDTCNLYCRNCIHGSNINFTECDDISAVIRGLGDIPEFVEEFKKMTKTNVDGKVDKPIRKKTGSGIERRNYKGETALHRAAIKVDLEQCQSLIYNSHPVNCCDNAGWTPLHEACALGNEEIVKLLIEHGADPNRKSLDGDCALHDAATCNAYNCAQILLKHGADPGIRNNNNQLPIDLCTDEALKKLLLDGQVAYDKNISGTNEEDKVMDGSEEIGTVTTDKQHIEDRKKELVLSWTGFSSAGVSELMKLCKQLSEEFSKSSTHPRVICAALSSRTTHLICNVNEKGLANRTANFLLAIIYGCKVVSKEWIIESIKSLQPVDCSPYLIKGTIKNPTSQGAIRRADYPIKDKRIFVGWQFFLAGRFDTLSREQLSSLLIAGQARVLRKVPDGDTWAPSYDISKDAPKGVHILYDKGHNKRSIPNLPANWPDKVQFKFVGVDWLCDCIEHYKLFPTT